MVVRELNFLLKEEVRISSNIHGYEGLTWWYMLLFILDCMLYSLA